MKKRVHLLIRGLVQGVGFRFFAYRVATDLGITGFVRNLPDGAVEILAEGEEDALRRFVEYMKGGPRSAVVESVEENWAESQEEFTSFSIKF